jgi:hypothetical protein
MHSSNNLNLLNGSFAAFHVTSSCHFHFSEHIFSKSFLDQPRLMHSDHVPLPLQSSYIPATRSEVQFSYLVDNFTEVSGIRLYSFQLQDNRLIGKDFEASVRGLVDN